MKRVTVADAPAVLNTNDRAFWAIGWNDCAEVAESAVKQARIDALEEAKRAVADVDEPGWTGYECPNTFQDGVHACAVAIESLKGKTP